MKMKPKLLARTPPSSTPFWVFPIKIKALIAESLIFGEFVSNGTKLETKTRAEAQQSQIPPFPTFSLCFSQLFLRYCRGSSQEVKNSAPQHPLFHPYFPSSVPFFSRSTVEAYLPIEAAFCKVPIPDVCIDVILFFSPESPHI